MTERRDSTGDGGRDEMAARNLRTSQKLLALAREGDERAREVLFERYRPALRRWATGRLPAWARDLLDTDDLVQDTLLHTIQALPRFEVGAEDGFHAYLRQAFRNRIRDEIRRVRRRPANVEGGEDLADPSPSPLEEAIGREALDLYDRALGGLATEDREIVLLRIEMGMRYAEIARVTDRPSANAARMAVTRALARLARKMAHGS